MGEMRGVGAERPADVNEDSARSSTPKVYPGRWILNGGSMVVPEDSAAPAPSRCTRGSLGEAPDCRSPKKNRRFWACSGPVPGGPEALLQRRHVRSHFELKSGMLVGAPALAYLWRSVAMDAAALLLELHGKLLRSASASQSLHFEGLGAAGRHLGCIGAIPPKTKNQLIKLDYV